MLFNEFTFPFLVATMLSFVNAGSNAIPICEPPSLTCSMFKRSICEWSESGEPVWACRGLLETVTGPPQQNSADDNNDEDVVLGTYEYQIPLGSSQVASHSETNDVKFGTYTYPITTNNDTASPVESKSEVKVGTYTIPISSGESSSSKVEPDSDVQLGITSLPIAVNKGIEVGESNSNVQVGTYSYQVPSIVKSSVSKVETSSTVQNATYTSSSSGKNNVTYSESEEEDVLIQTYTIRVPIRKKSSVSKVESNSAVYTENTGSRTVEVAHDEDNTSSTKLTSEVKGSEAESETQVGTITSSGKSSSMAAVARSESDSDVQIGTLTYSSGKSSSSLMASEGTVGMGVSAVPISPQHSSSSAHSNSESSNHIGTYTYEVSSSNKTDSSSRSIESKSDVQLGSYTASHISSSISSVHSNADSDDIQMEADRTTTGKNVLSTQGDSEINAAAYANQGMKSSDAQAGSEVKTGTASRSASSVSGTESQIGIETHQVSSALTASQSQEQTGTNLHPFPSVGNSGHQSGSDTKVQLESHLVSSGRSSLSVSSTDSEAKLEKGSAVPCSRSETVVKKRVTADGALQLSQASAIRRLQQSSTLTADASALSSFATAGHHEFQKTGLGGGLFTSGGINNANWGTNQQHISGFSNAFNAQQYGSQTNGNARSIQTAENYFTQTGDSRYISHERSVGGYYGNVGAMHAAGSRMARSQTGNTQYTNTLGEGYGYTAKGSGGTSGHQVSSMGNILSPYNLYSGNNAVNTGQYKQYEANSAVGAGSAHQNYGSGTQNGQHSGYANYGQGSYQSLERSALASSRQLVSSGNGMYHWPQSWTPMVGLGHYGSNWLVGHNTPVINPQVAPQAMAYMSERFSSGSSSASTSSSRINPWFYVFPYGQNLSSRALGDSFSGLSACGFCKKLMSVFGGAAICDVLEPIILEIFKKILELCGKRLK